LKKLVSFGMSWNIGGQQTPVSTVRCGEEDSHYLTPQTIESNTLAGGWRPKLGKPKCEEEEDADAYALGG